MAEVGTITEVSINTDLVSTSLAGTAKRRAVVTLRVTSGGVTDTLDLTQYDSDIAAIESIGNETVAGAAAATAATYATTVVTFAGHTGSGVTTMEVVVTY
jgi:hypothetical protein